MSYIAKIKINNVSYPISESLYGTCATDSSTQTKEVTLSDFNIPVTGASVRVKFTYSNTAENPKLNINNTGAYPIFTNGTTAPSTTPESSWVAGSIISFTFDGTISTTSGVGAWIMNDWNLGSGGGSSTESDWDKISEVTNMPASPETIVSIDAETNSINIGGIAGYNNTPTYYTVIGKGSFVNADYSFAINGGEATGEYSTAIGGLASGYYSISIGGTASGGYAISIGDGEASDSNTVSIGGYGTKASGANSTAINGGTAEETDSIAIGNGAVSYNEGGVAIGSYPTDVNGDYGLAMVGGYARGDYSISIGYSSSAQSGYGVALGAGSGANSDYSVAIGNKSYSSAEGMIALGYNSGANTITGVDGYSHDTLMVVGYSGMDYQSLDKDGNMYIRGTFVDGQGNSLAEISESVRNIESALNAMNS